MNREIIYVTRTAGIISSPFLAQIDSLVICCKMEYNKVNFLDRKSKGMAIFMKLNLQNLCKAASIEPNTMTRLRRDGEVTLTVLNKHCKTLKVDIGDIIEFLLDDKNC